MRTLNVRRTVVLLVVAIVLAGSTHLLHSYQLQRKSPWFKNQAQAAWDDEPRRVVDAIRLMRAYLVLEPHDYEACEKLTDWYANLGRSATAYKNLEELVRTLETQKSPDEPTIQRVRQKLIEAAMNCGHYADAVAHLKKLPGDADVLNRLGMNLVRLGQDDLAIENFSAAIKLAPERIDIYLRKAMALRTSPVQRLPEAERCMAEMIAYKENAKSARGAPLLRQVAGGGAGKIQGCFETGRDHAGAAKGPHRPALFRRSFLPGRWNWRCGTFPRPRIMRVRDWRRPRATLPCIRSWPISSSTTIGGTRPSRS